MEAFEHWNFPALQAGCPGCNEAGGKGEKIPDDCPERPGQARPLPIFPPIMFRLYFLVPLLVPLALVKRDLSCGMFRRLERWMEKMAAKPGRAVACVGIFSFLVSMGLSLWVGIPVPHVHDEFGYLLLGDTFAHGRVTNPTPPLWEHFETIYELFRPTYIAIYPPAQGVVLALGERLGLPIAGVWLATALACATMCWALLAWMPGRWALAGGLLVALHPQILEWSQDYWGGAVAMGGGALVLGAFRRMLEEPRIRDAVWMGVGLGVLANSRPYEGFVFGMLILAALLIRFIAIRNVSVSIIFRRISIPLAAVLLLVGAQIAFYNARTTGNPLVMPHMLNDETYGIAPQFLFAKPRPEPKYRVPEIRELYEQYLFSYNQQRSSMGALARATREKIGVLSRGYSWSCLMVVALLALPCALARDRQLWIVLFIGLFFLMAQLMTCWLFPHYAAPAAGLVFVLVMQSVRSLHAWRLGTGRQGRNLVRGLAVLFVLSLFLTGVKMAAARKTLWSLKRNAILEKLRREPGNSLVLVEYAPNHNPHREWVYNEADIVHAKVILARDLGPEKNKELLSYFHDRKVWVLHPDAAMPQLEAYPGS
jgi:hypothetical protein